MRATSSSSAEKQAAEALVGLPLGVPTDFFSVETDGKRYLARCTMLHASKVGCVRFKFHVGGSQYWAPHLGAFTICRSSEANARR